ncbi:hypothetical protein [Occultella kanbiaonis]|uniref:hypothetical protein n=1 Tax=Occultella kanbiaonis TaxID=2675754 RepID=UPI0012B83844|nr:hypothetical protein [Occultella kanbiaonis]
MSTVNHAAVVGGIAADRENVSVMHALTTAGSPARAAYPIVTGGIAPVEVS